MSRQEKKSHIVGMLKGIIMATKTVKPQKYNSSEKHNKRLQKEVYNFKSIRLILRQTLKKIFNQIG